MVLPCTRSKGQDSAQETWRAKRWRGASFWSRRWLFARLPQVAALEHHHEWGMVLCCEEIYLTLPCGMLHHFSHFLLIFTFIWNGAVAENHMSESGEGDSMFGDISGNKCLSSSEKIETDAGPCGKLYLQKASLRNVNHP